MEKLRNDNGRDDGNARKHSGTYTSIRIRVIGAEYKRKKERERTMVVVFEKVLGVEDMRRMRNGYKRKSLKQSLSWKE